MVSAYEVCQDLSHNAWFFLSRGRRREDDRPMLLKTPYGDSPSPDGVRQLEHDAMSANCIHGFERLKALGRMALS
jgi:hypothetical protein